MIALVDAAFLFIGVFQELANTGIEASAGSGWPSVEDNLSAVLNLNTAHRASFEHGNSWVFAILDLSKKYFGKPLAFPTPFCYIYFIETKPTTEKQMTKQEKIAILTQKKNDCIANYKKNIANGGDGYWQKLEIESYSQKILALEGF